mmetsp:Transcript_9184/g.16225  ORF Transcript_9184/g.16225 Transcript_9184/m.16225 type:complete len:80 (-) Transcript_9184:138-377(-)
MCITRDLFFGCGDNFSDSKEDGSEIEIEIEEGLSIILDNVLDIHKYETTDIKTSNAASFVFFVAMLKTKLINETYSTFQ